MREQAEFLRKEMEKAKNQESTGKQKFDNMKNAFGKF